MKGWSAEILAKLAVKRLNEARLPAQKSRNKYGAVRTSGYASKLEALRAAELHILERVGKIHGLEKQPKVFLTDAKVSYRADFAYIQDGDAYWEDVKGVETDRFRMICKLWMVYGPGPLRIVVRDGPGRTRIAETILPR